MNIKRKATATLLVVLLCLTLSLVGCSDYSAQNSGREIRSINHRGYGDAPENTLSAFRLSKQKGFDYVECDVKFTKDNVAVLLHDERIERTSNGMGNIGNMTLEEVRQYDFGKWKGREYQGETIPTFEEFIDLCVELQLNPYVEIKYGAEVEQLYALVETVDQYDLPITWIARDFNILEVLANLRSNDRFGLVVGVITRKNLELLSLLAKDVDVFIDCNYWGITNSKIEMCKSYEIPLEVWTINSEKALLSLHPFISGVTSDYINAQEFFKII